jgi:hypothetical protein
METHYEKAPIDKQKGLHANYPRVMQLSEILQPENT